MRKLFIALAGLLATVCAGAADNNPVLSIEGGKVQGVSTDIKGVTVFRGIPFAAPPTGQNRWKAPQPVIPWEGVKVCDTFGHPPFQAAHYTGGYPSEWGYGDEAPYSEDCLYLNVWTPAAGKTNAKLPVTLWIHGGGFSTGAGSAGPVDGAELAKKGVVLISINHRLDVLGFLDLSSFGGKWENSVNVGMLDIVEALNRLSSCIYIIFCKKVAGQYD